MRIYIYGIPQILTLVAFWLALRVIEMMSYISISVCVFQKGCLEWRFKLQQWQSKPQNSGIHAVIHATQNAI
jgi:hypothetical protein